LQSLHAFRIVPILLPLYRKLERILSGDESSQQRASQKASALWPPSCHRGRRERWIAFTAFIKLKARFPPRTRNLAAHARESDFHRHLALSSALQLLETDAFTAMREILQIVQNARE